MGNECSSCCTAAEEARQEINDDNDHKVSPGQQHGTPGFGVMGNRSQSRGGDVSIGRFDSYMMMFFSVFCSLVRYLE